MREGVEGVEGCAKVREVESSSRCGGGRGGRVVMGWLSCVPGLTLPGY